ncbi:DUF3048 domain-containing protein [Candidatus Falkowbacteria bacterium]|nr:DUF3048 domain-containing protein [Candidatus Falkowbacteria bacterium]
MGRRLRPRPQARPLKFLITMGVCGFLLLVGLVKISNINFKSKTEQVVAPNPAPILEAPCLATNPLSGVCLKALPQKQQVVGVMFDNSPIARPQKGLDKADLVFEAIAEFPYTRFLAFYFSENLPDKIGPVRSARPYFVDWANELNAVYAHCGGSPDALNLLKKNGAKDLNEFYNQQYFYRSWNKVAPYNIFTSAELLKQALTDKNWFENKIGFATWQFKDDAEMSGRPETQEISIDFGNKDFAVSWKYNKVSNSYSRFQADHDVELSAKNLVLMYVDFIVKDNVGRREVKTIGTGKAVVFLDGKVVKGKWNKSTEKSRTTFFDELNQEIKFNKGSTWIEVVDSGVKVAY